MPSNELTTQCCVAGGGPAGIMLGYLLARAGVDVIVLEKHGDFLRDFRGDTVHPSTLRIMQELGLLEDFLKLPHRKVYQLEAWIGPTQARIIDVSGLPAAYNFIAMMPWKQPSAANDIGSSGAQRRRSFPSKRRRDSGRRLDAEGKSVVDRRQTGRRLDQRSIPALRRRPEETHRRER